VPTDRLDRTRAIGVVPVVHDDREAPAGCRALRPLAGITLLRRVTEASARSGALERLLVPVPPAVVGAAEELLADLADVPVELVPAQRNGFGARLLAALRTAPLPPDGVVVVADPLHPLAPAALVLDVLAGLAADGGCAGVVPVGPVTDTLKWVDEDDVITATADREAFRVVHSPQAYRAGALVAALERAGEPALRAGGVESLPRLVLAAGGRLVTVPAPGELVRITGPDELLLAEALLAP
jgi:2-C-methyl-D-erythritol 4-phosphate cytidylyltransferase